jgi:hypothetical protein
MSEPDSNEASGCQKTPQSKRRRKKNGQQEDVNTDDGNYQHDILS